MSFKKLIHSFGYAFNGLRVSLSSGQNIKIHLLFAVAVVIAGLLLKITTVEFSIVMVCIGVVISLEVLNTAIEKLCDFVSPQHHEKIKIIKDIAAAAVLIMAIFSAIVGLIIFIPKLC